MIIAEIGVNHNGSYKLAEEMIKKAADSKADTVKFQIFIPELVATKTVQKANYQKKNDLDVEHQLGMLSKLSLTFDEHARLAKLTKGLGLGYMSTAFDFQSLAFLVEDIGVKTLKVPSGEITNAPFLLRHAQTGLDIILSTGMSDLADIENALGVIAYGYQNSKKQNPSFLDLKRAYTSKSGQALLDEKVTILHCTSEYPASIENVNLLSMQSIASCFGKSVGYSDHTLSLSVPVVATTLGAKVIEKHFTVDRALKGPDQPSSLEPDEFKKMVELISEAKICLGSSVKSPTEEELLNQQISRKFIAAAADIKKGEKLNNENIELIRAGAGLSPMLYWQILNKSASKPYKKGEPIIE